MNSNSAHHNIEAILLHLYFQRREESETSSEVSGWSATHSSSTVHSTASRQTTPRPSSRATPRPPSQQQKSRPTSRCTPRKTQSKGSRSSAKEDAAQIQEESETTDKTKEKPLYEAAKAGSDRVPYYREVCEGLGSEKTPENQ